VKEIMIEKVPILRIVSSDRSAVEDAVVREHSATIVLNDREVVTLMCSPADLEYLAAGFLLSEGLIKDRDDIITTKATGNRQRSTVRVKVKESAGSVKEAPSGRIIASSGGRGMAADTGAVSRERVRIESRLRISVPEIIALMERFHQSSLVFTTTGGVHSAALCSAEDIIVFSDDIGRHNTIDRVFGECLMRGIATSDRLVVTSGRVSSEIVLRVAGRDVPVIISISAPTDLAVRIADSSGMTLVGFVRGGRMNIYTHEERIDTSVD